MATGKHKLNKLNFCSCVLVWSYDPLETGPPHRHLMAVRWLASGCASSFGQGDLRQKAAFCCSSGAAAGISEKSRRGHLEDKTNTKSVEEFCLLLQFHCAFVVVQRRSFFSRAVYSFSKLLTPHQDNKGKNEHSIYRLTSLKGPRASPQTQQTSSCISFHLVCVTVSYLH